MKCTHAHFLKKKKKKEVNLVTVPLDVLLERRCCPLHVGSIRASRRMIELTPRDLKPYTHGHWVHRNGQHVCAFVEGLKHLSEQGFRIHRYCFCLIYDALTDLAPFQTWPGERNKNDST